MPPRTTELEYQLSFTTPAFLGNAEQEAQWRTPPIKALLRSWWRVLRSSVDGSDWPRVREAEGRLFGNAWLADQSGKPLHCKSLVRLRIEPDWSRGNLGADHWPNDFERVQTTRSGGSVPADLYLGYGPIQRSSANQTIRRAIDTQTTVRLRLLVPRENGEEIQRTLTLVQWFGAIGSRSRNGWGSVWLNADGKAPLLPDLKQSDPQLIKVLHDWRDCHRFDWPRAIGSDGDRPLIWRTEPLENWRKAIGALANVRLAVRRAAKTIRNPRGTAGALHYLGYPAGTGNQNPWALDVRDKRDTLRLASPLRFKVVPAGRNGEVRGLVFHLPCAIPATFLDQLRNPADRDWLANSENRRAAWQEIHRTLDQHAGLRRLSD